MLISLVTLIEINILFSTLRIFISAMANRKRCEVQHILLRGKTLHKGQGKCCRRKNVLNFSFPAHVLWYFDFVELTASWRFGSFCVKKKYKKALKESVVSD